MFPHFSGIRECLGAAGFFEIVSYIKTVSRSHRIKFDGVFRTKPNPIFGTGEPLGIARRGAFFGVNAFVPAWGKFAGAAFSVLTLQLTS